MAAAVTGESGEAAACSLAREGRRRQSLGPGVKTPKPLLSAKQKQQPSYVCKYVYMQNFKMKNMAKL